MRAYSVFRQSGCSRLKISEPNSRSRDAKAGAHARSERPTTASASRSSNGRIRGRMDHTPPDTNKTEHVRTTLATRFYARKVLRAEDCVGEDGHCAARA